MVPCSYCEHPLTCDACGAEYSPPSPEAYQALSMPEVALLCPVCEGILVCHWCKTPYDGATDDEGTDAPTPTRAG